MSQITLKDTAKKNDGLAPGHRLCAGCDESLIVRMVLKATRGPTIATSATGCLEVATSIFPYTAWNIPWIHVAFENAAANASGIEAAWKAMRRKNKGPLAKYETLDVIAFAGDGGTYDIGLQALSGALERGHDFTYVLLDNEAYMNKGWKKPIDDIVIAHGIPYLATLSASWPLDVIRKTRKALEVDGPAFLHAIAPCTRGWRYPTNKTIEVSRLAVQTCAFPLYECRFMDGRPVYDLSGPSRAISRRPETKKPVEEYLKIQGRYRHLFRPERRDDILNSIQAVVDHRWEILLEKVGV
jgi:pyruvate ferredoxin oxidoreductase beta subunit